jgi:hypothetical protein
MLRILLKSLCTLPQPISTENCVSAVLIHRKEHLSVRTETEHWLTEFYVLLTVHLITIFVNNQPDAQFFFLYLFIPVLYMFRATKCSSPVEPTVSIRHLVYVTVCRWPCGTQVLMVQFHLNLRTTRSPTYSDIYQMSYWYNWLSWWWALGCSKHVENWNKQTEGVQLKSGPLTKPWIFHVRCYL